MQRPGPRALLLRKLSRIVAAEVIGKLSVWKKSEPSGGGYATKTKKELKYTLICDQRYVFQKLIDLTFDLKQRNT